MTVMVPTTAAELLAIVLCPARVFGSDADTARALRPIKAAIIRRYRAAQRC